MKALSLWQPWASLVAIGAKKWETRSWPLRHKGMLAIHAAKKQDEDSLMLCVEEPFRHVLHTLGGFKEIGDLPFGAVVCVVSVCECLPTEDALKRGLIDARERAFGDYRPGRFCTRLEVVKRFEKPIEARGAQGLWNWMGVEHGGQIQNRVDRRDVEPAGGVQQNFAWV